MAVATEGPRGVVVELNSETDFVARNPDFQGFVRQLSEISLSCDGDFEATSAATMQDGQTVSDALTKMIGSIGENLTFRRSKGLAVTGWPGSQLRAQLCGAQGWDALVCS